MPPTSSYEPILENPKFKELVRARTRFAWTLSLLMFAIYFGFILVVAFGKSFLAQKLGTGVTTVGIPIGIGVIVSAFILTGVYVTAANRRFDEMSRDLIKEVTK